MRERLIDTSARSLKDSRRASHRRCAISVAAKVWRISDTLDVSQRRPDLLVIVGLLTACAGPKIPAPNGAGMQYHEHDRGVQVTVSSLQPPTTVPLVANDDGTRYAAAGTSLVSGPMSCTTCRPQSVSGSAGSEFQDAAAQCRWQSPTLRRAAKRESVRPKFRRFVRLRPAPAAARRLLRR